VNLTDMAQRKFRASVSNSENVVSFHRSAVTDRGATALELVYQAADVFRDMEEHARETEARAQSLCDSALQGIRRAEARAEEAEQAQRDLVADAEEELERASRALAEIQSRLEATEDRLTAAEFRAQAAESQVRAANQALALIEETLCRLNLS
jgi:chromosome segregation ATPase